MARALQPEREKLLSVFVFRINGTCATCATRAEYKKSLFLLVINNPRARERLSPGQKEATRARGTSRSPLAKSTPGPNRIWEART